MFTCQRTNVYAVRIPTSRSVPTSKSSAYEGTDSWNKDVLGWPRVGTLHSPAPGNQATRSLGHPLQNRHVTNYPTPTLIWLLSAPYTWEGHHLTGKRGRVEEPPALGHRSTQFSNLQSPRTREDLSPALKVVVQIDDTTVLFAIKRIFLVAQILLTSFYRNLEFC